MFPSSILHWDSNSQPLEHVSPAITTILSRVCASCFLSLFEKLIIIKMAWPTNDDDRQNRNDHFETICPKSFITKFLEIFNCRVKIRNGQEWAYNNKVIICVADVGQLKECNLLSVFSRNLFLNFRLLYTWTLGATNKII